MLVPSLIPSGMLDKHQKPALDKPHKIHGLGMQLTGLIEIDL